MKKNRTTPLSFQKWIALGTAAVLSFGLLPACSTTPDSTPTPENDAIYKAGAYTSEQSTGFAKVVVTAEFSETALTAVSYNVTETQETDYFPKYEAELKEMCDAIVSAQSTAVDGVSGATLCSKALKNGVSDGIAQASLNPATPAPSVPVSSEQPTAEGDFYAQVSDWLYSKDVASASYAGAFLTGEENTPTEEDIRKILETANNYQWCHMLTAPHFIVIRDPEEQKALLPEMGVTGDGTVTILVLADGVKDQEFHEEAYDGRDADDQHYWQMYYCIYEAGEAASMLNLAARSLGYRTRNYGAIHLYNQGVKDQFPDGDGVSIWYAGGNFDYIGGENWDISKYCSPKEGGEPFQHWFGGGYVDGEMTGKYVDVEGNLTLLCAIVLGRIDETDAISGATGTEENWNLGQKQYNYNFWD